MSDNKSRNEIKEMLIAEYDAGTLFDSILDRFWKAQDEELDEIVNTFAALHNEGRLNLIEMVREADLDSIETRRFFGGPYFIDKVIPKIKAPVKDMMECVAKLVRRGGTDGMANQPNGAFREWCKADLARCDEIIQLAKDGDELSVLFLTFALEASISVETALDFVSGGESGQRLASLLALGRMEISKNYDKLKILHAIMESMERHPSDELIGRALEAAFKITDISEPELAGALKQIVGCALSEPGEKTLHIASQALLWNSESFDDDILKQVLSALTSVNPNSKGTIDMVDGGLRNLLEQGKLMPALEFVEGVVAASEGKVPVTAFDSFCHILANEKPDALRVAVVNWLLSDDTKMCQGLHDVLAHHDRALSLPRDLIPGAADQKVRLAHRAIGYFYLQPVIAGSILVSILRHCDERVAAELRSLLFNPLLLSYGGNLRGYLEGIEQEDPAYAHIQSVLEAGRNYLDGLGAIGKVCELHPSESERQLEALRTGDIMRKALGAAQKESVFFRLMSRSNILYGRRTVSFISDPSGERRMVEAELKPHSSSMEVPRLDNVDPIGLQFMLFTFRR